MRLTVKKLLSLNVLLVVFICTTYFVFNKNESSYTTERVIIALEDTSMVDKVLIGNSILEKESPFWRFNSALEADPQVIKSILSIFQRIEIKRIVPIELQEELKGVFNQQGISISIFAGEDSPEKKYKVTSYKNESYIRIEGEFYNVHVPGYNILLGDFFQVNEDTWRNKNLLYTSWRTLKKFELKYTGDAANSFELDFNGTFYEVKGIAQLDSTVVYEYVRYLPSFKASTFVKDQHLKDSLLNVIPLCVLTLEDLQTSLDNTLSIYPSHGVIYGISSKDDAVVALARDPLRKILVNRAYFSRKKEQ